MKDDSAFLEDLVRSRAAVWDVGAFLIVQRPELRPRLIPSPTRPTAAQRREYADTGDIEVDFDGERVVEVKWRKKMRKTIM